MATSLLLDCRGLWQLVEIPGVQKNETIHERRSNTTSTPSQKNIASANTNKPRIGDSVFFIRIHHHLPSKIDCSDSVTFSSQNHSRHNSQYKHYQHSQYSVLPMKRWSSMWWSLTNAHGLSPACRHIFKRISSIIMNSNTITANCHWCDGILMFTAHLLM